MATALTAQFELILVEITNFGIAECFTIVETGIPTFPT